MDELLSKENLEWQERARAFARTHIAPVAAELDRTAEYPWSVINAARKEGLMGLWIPQEYGGLGRGLMDLCLVAEEFSKVCGAVGVGYAVNALGSIPILIGGTEEQKKRWLPLVARGEKLIAFGLSEKDAGSDAGSLKTRAVRDGDFYVIDGDKKWTTNAGAAELYTVFASTNPDRGSRGISAILVEKGMPGFEIGKREDLMGIRCITVHELYFRGCRTPAGNLLGNKEGTGFYTAMQTLDRARPFVAAQALGLAQGALDLAVNHLRNRHAFGGPLISQQGLQFMLADMAMQIEAARRLVYAAAQAGDLGAKNATKLASMAKCFASDVAMKVTTDAVQLFGGYGYCRDYPVEKFMRDAKITQIYEGTNQVQRLVIARNLIREAAGESK